MSDKGEKHNSIIWLKIHIPTTASIRDVIINYVFEIGSSGCEEKQSEIIAYFPGHFNQSDLVQKIQTYISELTRQGHSPSSQQVWSEVIPSENWHTGWRKYFKPLQVTDRILVKPTWCKQRSYKHSVVIEIDPSMAFGTGIHATTRLMLQLLEQYLESGDSVLDVGTGTAILAIAAAKLGASSVFACDIDRDAITTARQNIVVNNCQKVVKLWIGSIEALRGSKFKIVMVNMISSKLVPLLPLLPALILPQSIILLSGVLKEEELRISEFIKKIGMVMLEKKYKDEWIAVVLKT